MAILAAIVIGLGLLFLWLVGHRFGWVVAGPVLALVVQAVFQDPADTAALKIMRALAIIIAAGVPCFAWGSFAESRH